MIKHLRYLFSIAALLFSLSIAAQVTIDDSFATADDEITITYDATQGVSGLVSASRVFMHAGVILDGPNGTSWQHVVGNWGDPNSAGEMTSLGNDLWEITITPRTYFAGAGLDANALVYRLGLVFREAGPCGGFSGVNTACAEGKNDNNQDIFVDLATSSFTVNIVSPTESPKFVEIDEIITVEVEAPEASELELYQNDVLVANESNATSLTYEFSSPISGRFDLRAVRTELDLVAEDEITMIVRQTTVNESRPAGIIDGINYDENDDTKATLSLWAPLKSSVYVVGDFTDWQIDPAYQMKKDGEHFWLEVNGLTPGQEYAFRYLVDETLKVVDPYSDKILDRDDQWIPSTTYPNLMPYPGEAGNFDWHDNRISVLQTAQVPYNWQITNFQPPAKEDLVIYELLLRDFFEPGEQTFQNLIDTLGYFERLGINAIELMPIMEFNGNESWGYNPTFMFAVDKFYGPKNKFKEFVDEAHARGIAVILDIAMNHQDVPGTYVKMYFDFNTFTPTAENPWFNVSARHPFNVFSDMDHESSYTQAYLDTVNHYWLNEYKVDGFRFDLSKGFTQTNSGSNVGQWSSFDASRVALLGRMASKIWEHSPNAYVMLEHFADNSEEVQLSNQGMMLWGNMNHAYGEVLMGYEGSSDITGTYSGTRGFSGPNLIAYMESHDEERLTYKLFEFGNSNISYDTRDKGRGLQRSKALASIFYSIPGPKMLWQFGEFGYDFPLGPPEERLNIKPTRWEYLDDNQRASLFSVVAEMIRLKTTYPIFKTTDVTLSAGASLQKFVVLRGVPYSNDPQSEDEMNVVVSANFDLINATQTINFPHTGTWYDYFGEEDINVTNTSHTLSLKPGEFRLYTDFELASPDIVLSNDQAEERSHAIYPNPTTGLITIDLATPSWGFDHLQVTDIQGRPVDYQLKARSEFQLKVDLKDLQPGMYILKIGKSSSRVIVR